MHRKASDLALALLGTVSAWGVAEWNQAAGIAAFGSATVYSITKTYLAIRDRNRSKNEKS